MDMTELTAGQIIGLQALMGMMQNQQPAGQMVDIGHGYRAWVPNSGWGQLSGAVRGAVGGAAQGALQNYMREQALKDREDEAGRDFARKLDFLDKQAGYREIGAEADHGRSLRRMKRQFDYSQQGADADLARRFDELDRRFALGEESAGAEMARRVDFYNLQGRDRVAEALAAAGVAPSEYTDRAAGLDALAAEIARVRAEEDAYSRAETIDRLTRAGVPLERALQMVGGGIGGQGGAAGLAGMGPVDVQPNPLSERGRGVAAAGGMQDALLEKIKAARAGEERKKSREDYRRATTSPYRLYP